VRDKREDEQMPKSAAPKVARFLNKIGQFTMEDPVTRQVMFKGTYNTQTSVAITMSSQDTKGGMGNALLMRTTSDRMVEVSMTAQDWNLEYVAASTGSKIESGLAEIYAIDEAVVIGADGVGKLAREASGKVSVKLPSGGQAELDSQGGLIDLGGRAEPGSCVKATYRRAVNADTVAITADKSPIIGRLYLQSGISDARKGLIGELLVEIPSFALDGNLTISSNANGEASSIEMKGVALAADGGECKEGSVYGYVREVLDDYAPPAVVEISAGPSPMELALLPSPESGTVSVVGLRGALYSTVGIEAGECVFSTGSAAVATVSAAGVVLAVSAGTAEITVVHTETGLSDTVDVVVS
jgi:hypothetical protein